MANTLIQQTAIDFVFGGETDTVDYTALMEALAKGEQAYLDFIPSGVYLSERFETDETGVLYETLTDLSKYLTQFASDVLASV